MRELRPGDQLAGYRIDAVVGRGGMGIVYRATHLALQRTEALKVITPELAQEPQFRSRFERESQLAAHIDHPNVIPIYAAGEEDGLLYIAMRFVDGTDLRAVLRREGRIDPGRAARIVAAVGAALDAAHEQGLVHRDVKPANVLLARRRGLEHIYLTDFGLAKVTASGEHGDTRAGMFLGTTDYVSPEQALGTRLDARSDVYSLGATLFHMLTGEVPYPGVFEAAKLVAHTRHPVPSVLALAPDLAPEFEAVVARAMAKSPADRFLSAGDLGRAALAADEGRTLVGGRGSVGTGAAAPSEANTSPGLWRQASGARTPVTASPAPGKESIPTPETPAVPRTHAATEPAARGPARPLRRWLTAGAVIATVVAAVIVAIVLAAGPGRHRPSPARGARRGSAFSVHQFTNGAIPVGRDPDGIVIDQRNAWVANAGAGTVTHIDAIAGNVLGTIRYATHPVGEAPITTWRNTVWVGDARDGTITRIDGVTGKVLGSPIRIGGAPDAITAAAGDIWIANGASGTVLRIDASTGTLAGPPIPVGAGAVRLAVHDGSVWAVNAGSGTVTRIDASTGQPLGTIKVSGHPNAITFAAGAMWLANAANNTVFRIDATSSAPLGSPIRVGVDPVRMVASPTGVWVANAGSGTVTWLDPVTGQVLGTIRVGGHPNGMTLTSGIIWVVAHGQPGGHHGGMAGAVMRIEARTGKVLPASATS